MRRTAEPKTELRSALPAFDELALVNAVVTVMTIAISVGEGVRGRSPLAAVAELRRNNEAGQELGDGGR